MTITQKLDDWGPMTVLMIAVAIIAMVVGGAVVVFNPEALSFQQYLDNLKTFAIAIAGLAGARGILGVGKHVADAKVQAAALATEAPAQPPAIPAGEVPAITVVAPADVFYPEAEGYAPHAEVGLQEGDEDLVDDDDLPTDEEEFAALGDQLDGADDDDYYAESGDLALAASYGGVRPDPPEGEGS